MKRMLAVAAATLGMCAPAMAQMTIDAAPADAADLGLPEFEQPDLWFGSKAPELKIAEFIKGDAVTSFENGRVYVIEFWATWCGPCIKAFPHLSKLQDKYGDKVTFVGVNIWDTNKKDDESQADRIKRVAKFVDEQGDRMGYTVAVESDEEMATNWMKAAGRNGIPSAFIVDGSGVIAWMGSPHDESFDTTIEQIVAGEYDSKAAAHKVAKDSMTKQWADHVMKELREGDAEAGYKLATKMIAGPWKDDAQMLNQVAWMTLVEPGFPVRNPKFSIKAATRACEITNWEDPMIMDTLARAYYEDGNAKKAFKIQSKAVELIDADAEYMGEFEEWLATYKKAAGED